MRNYVILAMGLLATVALVGQAEIYKTVDKKGRTVYTDLPPADVNAKAIELQKINTVPKTESIPGLAPTQSAPTYNASYEVAITSPQNGYVLRPEDRSLSIMASLNQGLGDGDKFVYMIDGNSVEETTDTGITVDEPPRGEHSITVKVTNAKGDKLAESDPVSVIIQRPLRKSK